MVRLLLSVGLAGDVRDDNGRTPLDRLKVALQPCGIATPWHLLTCPSIRLWPLQEKSVHQSKMLTESWRISERIADMLAAAAATMKKKTPPEPKPPQSPAPVATPEVQPVPETKGKSPEEITGEEAEHSQPCGCCRQM